MAAAAAAPIEADMAIDAPPRAAPAHIVVSAAPKAAPLLMPMICGSARGFLKMLCICEPESAMAAPARSAVVIRGSLRCSMISCPAWPPHVMSARHAKASKTRPAAMTTIFLRVLMLQI